MTTLEVNPNSAMNHSELFIVLCSQQITWPTLKAVAIFCLLLVLAVLLRWVLRSMTINAYMRYFTTLKDIPTAGCASTFVFLAGNPERTAQDLIKFAKEHQPIFLQNNRVGAASVIVMDLEALNYVMVSKQEFFGKPKFARNAIGSVLGRDGLLFADGDQYNRIRKYVSPAMHNAAVIKTSAILLSEANKLRDRLSHASLMTPEGQVQIKKEAGIATCNVILQFCTGKYWKELQAEELEQMNAAYERIFGSTPLYVVLTLLQSVFNFLNPDYFVAQRKEKEEIRRLVGLMLDRALRKQYRDEQKRQLQLEHEGGPDFLENDTSILALMARGSKTGDLKPHEMVDTVMTFLAAGQSTTQMTVSWTLYLLGKHNSWLKKVQAELDGMQASPEGDPESYVREMDGLPLLQRVIKETLRMYPPIAQTGRVALTDVKLGKYSIPAGTVIRIPVMAIQRSPEHWYMPNTFNPDRFLPGSPKQGSAQKMAWLPFLYGQRGCIGQRLSMLEIKCFVCTILRTHNVFVNPTSEPPATSGSFNDPHGMELFMHRRDI